MDTEKGMNAENIDLEQMRKVWMEMGKILGMQPTPDNTPDDLNRKRTALDRLRNRYKRFWILSMGMTFTSFMIFSKGLTIDTRYNLWLGIAYAVYFLTAFLMDLWLWNGIGTIDPLRMSVAEVAEKSMFYRKRHLQFMAILMPMAITLIGFTAYVFSTDVFFLYGMIAGAIFGITMGIIQFRRFMAEYRRLRIRE